MSTILIIDDDRIFRRLVVDALQKRGYQVLQATRGSEADALLVSNKADLLLVDGLLPDMTGLEWLEKQRKAGMDAPALFVTSFWKSEPDFEAVTRQLGATTLLRKPVTAQAVANQVAALLST
jgi:DNA-binding response OmpR family regulator